MDDYLDQQNDQTGKKAQSRQNAQHLLFCADLKQGTPEYKRLKEERSQVLWKAVEKIIPDIRSRTKIEMVRLKQSLDGRST